MDEVYPILGHAAPFFFKFDKVVGVSALLGDDTLIDKPFHILILGRILEVLEGLFGQLGFVELVVVCDLLFGIARVLLLERGRG